VTLENFMARCEAYFTEDGCIVDQPYQPRLPDGMIRVTWAAIRSSASAVSSSRH